MKPENICIGTGKKSDTFYLIDFGLSKRYICPKTCNHIEEKKARLIVGTLKYLSPYTSEQFEHSRRDDLISLAYILIMLLKKGELPWDI